MINQETKPRWKRFLERLLGEPLDPWEFYATQAPSGKTWKQLEKKSRKAGCSQGCNLTKNT